MSKIEITISRKELHSILSRVAPAMSNEETRYYLCGVCIEQTKAGLVFVATDGHRLHNVRTWLVKVSPATDFSIIVPRDLVGQILKQPMKRSEHDDPVEIVSVDGSVSFSFSGVTLKGALIDGTFPDWRRVVPAFKRRYFVQFSADYLADMLKTMKTGGAKYVLLHVEGPHEAKAAEGVHCESAPTICHDTNGGEYVLIPMRASAEGMAATEGRAVAESGAA